MSDTQFSLLHQGSGFKFKKWDHFGHIQPNVEYSEGIRPTGEFMPAPYLPIVSMNVYFEEPFVVMDGIPVGFDGGGYLVPAGYKVEAAAYKTTFDASGEVAADAAATIKYTAADVARGTKNAAGAAAVAGEPVVKSMFNIAGGAPLAYLNRVSNPVGIADYNFWAHPGGDGLNPATYNQYNFNLQHRVVFLTDYVIQLPVVTDLATYNAAPLKGMAAVLGALDALKAGMFVTINAASNFVPTATDGGYGYSAAEAPTVIGQIIEVRKDFPRDYLDRVRSQYDNMGDLEKMPGTATAGKPDVLTFSGGHSLVSINLIQR